MPNETNIVLARTSQALNRLVIFGPTPLLAGESAAAYDDLLAGVSGNLKPSDIFEEIWVRKIADFTWESLRWRRHLRGFLATAIPKMLERILKPLAQNQPEPVSSGGSFTNKLRAAQASHNAVHTRH